MRNAAENGSDRASSARGTIAKDPMEYLKKLRFHLIPRPLLNDHMLNARDPFQTV